MQHTLLPTSCFFLFSVHILALKRFISAKMSRKRSDGVTAFTADEIQLKKTRILPSNTETVVLTLPSTTGTLALASAIPPVGDYVTLDTAQTISAVKTFTSPPVMSSVTNSGTITLPSTTDTLVGKATTDILTNKNLTSGTNTFPMSLVTLTGTQTLTNKDLSSGTNTLPTSVVTLTGTQTLTNKTLTAPVISSIINGAATLSFPTVSDLLIGADAPASLSNKNLTSSNNTFPAYLATVNSAQTITGVKTFSTAPVISTITNGGTLTLPSSATDTLVGQSTSDTLTNKNLTSGTNTFPTSLVTLTGSQTLTNKDLSSSSNVFPRSFTRLTTPYSFMAGTTLSSGVSQDFQVSGFGTPVIPSSSSAVLCSFYGSASAGTSYISGNAQGSFYNNAAKDCMIFQPNVVGVWATTVILPLNSSNGKITLQSSGGNFTGINGTAIAYLY